MGMTIDKAILRVEHSSMNVDDKETANFIISTMRKYQMIENTVEEIRKLIKRYAPRPRFINQKYLEIWIAQETLSQIKAEFIMDEWVIGHISEVLDKYDYDQRKEDENGNDD